MTSQPPETNKSQAPAIDFSSGGEVVYVNLVRIAHTPADFVFDFAHIIPGVQTATIRSRIVMSPISAKMFYRALAENLAKYEAAFGEIKIPGDNTLADHLFRGSGSPPHSSSE